MKKRSFFAATPLKCLTVLFATSVLLACGGGGGGGGGLIPTAATWAASGTYIPVPKLQGSVTANPLSVALSLVHPSSPEIEYVMDANPFNNRLGFVLPSGNYDTVARKFVGLQPMAYVDAPNDGLRTTRLIAAGAVRPLQAQAAPTPLCSASIVAYNFVDPFATQFVVATPGADLACGTADDKQLLVSFSSAGTPAVVVNPFGGGRVLGYLRSLATGAPTHWLVGAASGEISLEPILAGARAVIRAALVPAPVTPPVYKPVANFNDLVFFMEDGALKSVSAAVLPATLASLSVATGPDGWQIAGFDDTNVFIYLNSSTALSGSGTWQMLSVSRTSQTATPLTNGAGSIFAAAAMESILSQSTLYASVQTGGSSVLLSINRVTGAQSNFIAPSTTSSTTFTAFNSRANLLVTASTVPGVGPLLRVVDDGGFPYLTMFNSLPYGADVTRFDVVSNSSVTAGLFLVGPITSTALGGSGILRFDLAGKSTIAVGNFPDGSALGGFNTDQVFAGPLLTMNNGFGGTGLARVVSGQLQASGSAVYTFNANSANSLLKTTVQVR